MHFTNTSITAATEALYKDRMNSLSSFLILLDLWITRSSFPTHANFGTRNYALIWFSSYLQDQSYPPPPKHTHTHTQKTNSLTSGVPQDTVLNPLLFSLYNIKFLGSVIRSLLLFSFSLQSLSDQIRQPFWHLFIDEDPSSETHLSKTKLIYYSKKNSPLLELSISIEALTVHPAHMAEKNLGLILDDGLRFFNSIMSTTWSCRFLLLHQKHMSFSDYKTYSASYISPSYFQTWLLQLSTCWSPIIHNISSTEHSECHTTEFPSNNNSIWNCCCCISDVTGTSYHTSNLHTGILRVFNLRAFGMSL